MANNSFQQDVIGELTGLKAVLQSVVGRIAVLSEMGTADIKQMHEGAHVMLSEMQVTALGTESSAIRARAEHTVDHIFGTLSASMSNRA